MCPFFVSVPREAIKRDVGVDYADFEYVGFELQDLLAREDLPPGFSARAKLIGKSAGEGEKEGQALFEATQILLTLTRPDIAIAFTSKRGVSQGNGVIAALDISSVTEGLKKCAIDAYRISPFFGDGAKRAKSVSIKLISALLVADYEAMIGASAHINTGWVLRVLENEIEELFLGYYFDEDPYAPLSQFNVYGIGVTFRHDEMIFDFILRMHTGRALFRKEPRTMLLDAVCGSLSSRFSTSSCRIDGEYMEGFDYHLIIRAEAAIPDGMQRPVIGGGTVFEAEIYPPIILDVAAELSGRLNEEVQKSTVGLRKNRPRGSDGGYPPGLQYPPGLFPVGRN